MLAKKAAVAAEHLQLAIGQNKPLGHFAAPFGRIDQQGANAPVNINLTVRKRGASKERQIIERFAMGLQMQSKGFEHARTVVKIQCAQSRAPVAFGIVPHGRHIWHPAQNAEGLTGDRRANLPPAAV